MTFAAPLALLWALAMAPIVALYVLKVRQRRMVVPTTMFWQQVFEDKRPRTLWQRMRHLLSLLVQLLIVALMVLALAQPLLGWQMLEPRRIVLIVDTSASMSATDVAPSRLAEAQRRAAGIIEGLRYFDTMAVIAAASQPQVACGMTAHQRTLQQAVEAIEPTDAPTDLAPAIELARRLLAGDEDAHIIVLTDGGFDTATVADAKDVEVIRIGGRAENLAITQFQVRRSLVDPLGYEALVEVRNFSDKPADTRLEIYLGEAVVDVFPLTLDPGAKWTQTLEKTSAPGGTLKAMLVVQDALAIDNAAYAVLPERRPQDVVLVTKGNMFLQRVFEAMPLVNLRVVDAPPPPGSAAGTIVVYHRQVPLQLPAGHALIIDPEASSDLWEAAELLENPLVAQQDTASPLMAHVRLDNVYMPEARKLKPAAGAKVLAAAVTGDPIYFGFDSPPTHPEAGRRVLVLTANLDRGDLPLRTAFPIIVANALAWFGGGGGEVSESASTAETTQVTFASHGAEAANVTSPSGRKFTAAVQEGRVTVGPLTQAGIWNVQRGQEVAHIAANLCDARESDLSPPEGSQGASSARASHASLTGKPTWFYLLAVACVLAAVEWFLYQRRWIS